MAEFTDEFKDFLRRMPKRPHASLSDFIEHEIKPLGIFDEARMYKPLILPVRASIQRGNFIGVRVTPWREGWWGVTQKGIAAMMGIQDSRKVDLRDIYGNSIKGMDVNTMARLDEVEVYDGGDRILVTNPPVPHPLVHPNKDAMLHQWWAETSKGIAEVAADALVGAETRRELNARLAVENPEKQTSSGAVEQAIRDYLSHTVNAEFVRTFSENDYAAGVTPEELRAQISGLAMANIRHAVAHSTSDILRCLEKYAGDDDLLASATTSNTRVTRSIPADEYQTYRYISNTGLEQGKLSANVGVVARYGHPHKYHKHRHHPHHGHHHHPHGHPHKNNSLLTIAVTKKVDAKPFGQPTRDMPAWLYGTVGHEYYTKGAGARRAAGGASSDAYRGDYDQALNGYHFFSGRAPAPTPSLLGQTGGPSDAAAQEQIGGWFSDTRAKYRKNRLKNARRQLQKAQDAGNTGRAKFWGKRVAYWEGKTAKDADVDELISQAIFESTKFGDDMPIEAMAHATWLIGCGVAKPRDTSYYQRMVQLWQERLDAANEAGDPVAARDALMKVEKYRKKLLAVRDYPSSVDAAYDDPYHRLLAVEEAIVHGAPEFLETARASPVVPGDSINERIVNTMAKYLIKYAAEEGPEEAMHLAQELREEAPSAAARSLWGSVVLVASEHFSANAVANSPGMISRLSTLLKDDQSTLKRILAYAQDNDEEALISAVEASSRDARYPMELREKFAQWAVDATELRVEELNMRKNTARKASRVNLSSKRAYKELSAAESAERRALRKRQRALRRFRPQGKRAFSVATRYDDDREPVILSVVDTDAMNDESDESDGDNYYYAPYQGRRVGDWQQGSDRLTMPELGTDDSSDEEDMSPRTSPEASVRYYDRMAERAAAERNRRAQELYEDRASEARDRMSRPLVAEKAPRMQFDEEGDSLPVFQPRDEPQTSVRVGDRVIRLVDRNQNPMRVEQTAQGLVSREKSGGLSARLIAERRMSAAKNAGDHASAQFYQNVLDQLPAAAPVPTPSKVRLVSRDSAPPTRTVKVSQKVTSKAPRPISFDEMLRRQK